MNQNHLRVKRKKILTQTQKNVRKRRNERNRKKKLGANPWDVAESSSESSVEEEEEEHEDEDEELKFDNNEDEFACEELDPDDVPIVIRRARTVRKCK